MTIEHDQDAWLRAAFARSHDLHAPSPVPLNEILSAGRARKKRRRTTMATATAAAVLALGLGLPLFGQDATSGTATRFVPAASPSSEPAPVNATVTQGVVDGRGWSVTLEFYPTLPKGYAVGKKAEKFSAGKTSLVCQRMVIGGVRIDHQGGPWSDCDLVDGAHDAGRAGEMGLWGLSDKGTTGLRLLVANPTADVAYGVVHLSNGTALKASTVTVPGTDYRAWAVAIPAGRTITAVDTYNTHNQLLNHDTNWH